jgi:hypothetical protein
MGTRPQESWVHRTSRNNFATLMWCCNASYSVFSNMSNYYHFWDITHRGHNTQVFINILATHCYWRATWTSWHHDCFTAAIWKRRQIRCCTMTAPSAENTIGKKLCSHSTMPWVSPYPKTPSSIVINNFSTLFSCTAYVLTTFSFFFGTKVISLHSRHQEEGSHQCP